MVKALAFVFICLLSAQVSALNIAVTASFKPVIDTLAELFYEQSGITLRLSSASTGTLTQQIIQGAPFDVFLAADKERPTFVRATLNLPATAQQPYAFGSLVLVSTHEQVRSLADLANYTGRVVIANPQHAPYGVAAENLLMDLSFNGTLIRAQNVSQAQQYLTLNLAEVGLVAKAVAQNTLPYIDIPPNQYAPIEHHLLLLKSSDDAQAFLGFLGSSIARAVIQRYGYEPVPHTAKPLTARALDNG